eukprot:362837-Chlamydomonas_euryale.AAC.2
MGGAHSRARMREERETWRGWSRDDASRINWVCWMSGHGQEDTHRRKEEGERGRREEGENDTEEAGERGRREEGENDTEEEGERDAEGGRGEGPEGGRRERHGDVTLLLSWQGKFESNLLAGKLELSSWIPRPRRPLHKSCFPCAWTTGHDRMRQADGDAARGRVRLGLENLENLENRGKYRMVT